LKDHQSEAANLTKNEVMGATPMDIKLTQVNIKGQTTSNFLYYSPSEIQEAYDATPLYTKGDFGQGVTIAIVDAYGDPYIQSELNRFSAAYDIPTTTVGVVCVDGPCNYLNGIYYGWNGEIALDVEWAHAMAPEAKIYLYIGSTNAQPLYDAVAAAVAGTNGNGSYYPIPSVVSMSWGEPENDFGQSAAVAPVFGENYPWLNQVFQYGAAEGITFFASSGDWGAYDQTMGQTSPYGGAIYPSTDPFVTGVGGTSLYMSTTLGYLQGGWAQTPVPTAVGSYGYETAWSWNNYYSWGTGGGFSTLFNQPYWQTGPGVPSGETRGAPDVSWDADPLTGVIVYVSGGFWIFGGTSVGSPSWAGSMALIDQYVGHNLGFINPALYSILNNPSEYAAAFHDAKVGDNDPLMAGTGWDSLTGMGTPDIANLASLFSQPSTSLSVLASNSVTLGQSAAYGSTVTITTVASGVSTCTGYSATAQLTSSTGAAIGTPATNPVSMTCSSGTWTGTYTIVPSDPPGMWTATVTIAGSSSGIGMTTFSVGDGITIFQSWGFFMVGDTIPIAVVATAPDGIVDAGATVTATFYLGTPTGTAVGTATLYYVPLACPPSEPVLGAPTGCWVGQFTIPKTPDQGAWVMAISGTDSKGNSVAPAYTWLNVGLLTFTYTDSPTYVTGNTISIYFLVNTLTGTYSATIYDYTSANPQGTDIGTVSLSCSYGLCTGAFDTTGKPTGFYQIVVTGSDGLGNSAYGETLVRVAPLSLTATLTLSPSTAIEPAAETESVAVSVTYPNTTVTTVGSVDAFLPTEYGTFYASLTYNAVSNQFVGTLPVQAMHLSPGTYDVYISAFDPLGNAGEALGSFSIMTTSVTSPICTSPVTVGMPSICIATVTGYYPSGVVSFKASGSGSFNSTTCTLGITGSCAVAYTLSTTRVAPQTITASYGGDANNQPSSGTFTITVGYGEAFECASASSVVGTPTSCTVTVTGSTTPTGKVTLFTTGPGKFSPSTCTLTSGACSVKYTPNSVSSPVNLTAMYSGDKYNPPYYATFTLTVTKVISVVITSCPTHTVVGKTIKCTATVIGYSPIGTVTWSASGAGSVAFTSTTCGLSKGHCYVTMIATAAGLVTITGTYGGDSNNIGNYGPAFVTILPAKADPSLTCSSTSKDVWICTATLKGYYGPVAGETISWTQTKGTGRVSFSSHTCTLWSGSPGMSCSVIVTGTLRGSATIQAYYAGNSNNLYSSKTKTLAIK
jgi:hypothetical protein